MRKRLTINRLALSSLKHNKKKYLSLIIGIVLTMFFASGVPFFISGIESSQEMMMGRYWGKQDAFYLNAQNADITKDPDLQNHNKEIGYLHVGYYGWAGDDEKRGTSIVCLDELGEEIFFPYFLEGGMPKNKGEIAIEEDALYRMGLEDAKVGDTIQLHTRINHGSFFDQKTVDKPFQLVGILTNRRPLWEFFNPEIGNKIPAALMSKEEPMGKDSKESLIALLTLPDEEKDLKNRTEIINRSYMSTWTLSKGIGEDGYEMMLNTKLFTLISGLMAALSCFGIANILYSHLKERTQQIGMMRAVGATKRQIMWIYSRETILISLAAAPISLALSYVCVKIYGWILGDTFLFVPNVKALIMGMGISFLCVAAATIFPIVSMCRLSPMQTLRHIDMIKKMRKKRIRSRRRYEFSNLLSKRRRMFSGGRKWIMELVLGCMVGACCFSLLSLRYEKIVMDRERERSSDYTVHAYMTSSRPSFFYEEIAEELTESQYQEALMLSGVTEVMGQKVIKANLLMDQVPTYLLINEFAGTTNKMSLTGCTSRYEIGFNTPYPSGFDESEDAFRRALCGTVNPAYMDAKSVGGYSQEAMNIPFFSEETSVLESYSRYLLEGEINIDRLNSGEEIIVCAYPKLGFCHFYQEPYYDNVIEDTVEGQYVTEVLDLGRQDYNAYEEQCLDHIRFTAESPFHAGDSLRVSVLQKKADGTISKTDRDVRIGAVLSYAGDSSMTCARLYTTPQGLHTFAKDTKYQKISINISEAAKDNAYRDIEASLNGIFPDAIIDSAIAGNRYDTSTYENNLMSYSAIILILFAISVSLVNNNSTTQIQEQKRSIGTMRAVGASEREITWSYVLEIIRTFLWSLPVGVFLFILSISHIKVVPRGSVTGLEVVAWGPVVILAAAFICCILNLIIQVRKITKLSIVENIREL